MLTLENTDDAFKRAETCLQCQDIEGDKRKAFSIVFDKEHTGHEVKALRAALKEKNKLLSALEAK